MALEITGKLHIKGNTEQITGTFSKREFVLEIAENAANGMTYTNYASFQLVNTACASLDSYQEGQNLKVSFNLRGNRWEKNGVVKYITNLNAWRIEPAQEGMGAMPAQAAYSNPGTYNAPQQPAAPTTPNFNNAGGDDDLPF